MSKMDSYMQGRTEGMEFALRLVKIKVLKNWRKKSNSDREPVSA